MGAFESGLAGVIKADGLCAGKGVFLAPNRKAKDLSPLAGKE